jgi:hypothetical protein
MQVNLMETLWIAACLSGVVVTAVLVWDAAAERDGYSRTPNDSARRLARMLVLNGNIRRDSIRLATQLCLLAVVAPSLFRPGEVPLVLDLSTPESLLMTLTTVAVLSLLAVPVLLLVNSVLDFRDRRRLRAVVVALVEDERSDLLAAIDRVGGETVDAIDKVGDKADAAYHEANQVNVKIASLDQRLFDQGEQAAADRAEEKVDRAEEKAGRAQTRGRPGRRGPRGEQGTQGAQGERGEGG